MHEEETSSTQRGVYCVYLFRADMGGIYLCLAQGTEELRSDVGTARAVAVLRERAAEYGALLDPLADVGFQNRVAIDLRGEGARSRSYEQSVITSKFYPIDAVPDDEDLLRDLEWLLAAYDGYIAQRGEGEEEMTASAGEDDADPNGTVSVRSWSRPYGTRDLIGRKRVDWSLLRDGSTIPHGFVPDFNSANGGEEISRGERRQVVLEYEGEQYDAALVNVDRAGVSGDTVQIRYTSRPLIELLEAKFARTRAYLLRVRATRAEEGDRSLIRVPDDEAEYLDFLATGEPFRYRLGFHPVEAIPGGVEAPESVAGAIEKLIDFVSAQGYRFAPWQVVTYVMAMRTKPFVILAGATGTGKSKLPKLVAQGTGGRSHLVPVRPDWTDSCEVLGYLDLQSKFRPGPFLSVVSDAWADLDRYHVCIMDEMNLGRVEHYFAEILSRIEDRSPYPKGGFQSEPLVSQRLSSEDASWGDLGLPPNLGIVGTVNMDESAHGFSRKVLDRAFTLELSETDISAWPEDAVDETRKAVARWPASTWFCNAVKLQARSRYSADEIEAVEAALGILQTVNRILAGAQLQVGYRTRDEVAHFAMNSVEAEDLFVDHEGRHVSAMDVALVMKVLPRIAGGSMAIRRVIHGLLGWAYDGRKLSAEEHPSEIMDSWESSGRAGALVGAVYPRTSARLCLMLDRLADEGFTSFWA